MIVGASGTYWAAMGPEAAIVVADRGGASVDLAVITLTFDDREAPQPHLGIRLVLGVIVDQSGAGAPLTFSLQPPDRTVP